MTAKPRVFVARRIRDEALSPLLDACGERLPTPVNPEVRRRA